MAMQFGLQAVTLRIAAVSRIDGPKKFVWPKLAGIWSLEFHTP